MVVRPKFCQRCGRIIPKGSEIYCSDCKGFVRIGIDSDKNKCSHCKLTKLETKLWRNIKTNKLYCNGCAKIFKQGLEKSGVPSGEVNRIMRLDFEPIDQ